MPMSAVTSPASLRREKSSKAADTDDQMRWPRAKNRRSRKNATAAGQPSTFDQAACAHRFEAAPVRAMDCTEPDTKAVMPSSRE